MTNFDTFLLYYIAWHEGEYTIREIKSILLSDLKKNGLEDALAEFRKKRMLRVSNGDFRTLFQVMKEDEALKVS